MKFILLLIILFLVTESAFSCDSPDHEWERILNNNKYTIKGPFTIAVLEKNNMVKIRETNEVLPFGYMNDEWNKLKAMFKSGDKFYFVRYEDNEFFMELYTLVRDKCVIGVLRGRIS